jgi:hypothetical protein
VSIGGVPLPGNPDLTQVASAVNAALANLGMVVQFPGSTLAQGIEFESPLQVEVVPDPSRDQVTTTITGTVQNGSLPGGQTLPGGGPYYNVTNGLENGLSNTATPYNKSLGDALGQIEPAQIAQVLCQSDTPITVADVTIASFDGGGYFNFALGGVNASAGPLPPNPYNLSLFSLGNSLGSSQFLAGSLGTAGTPGTGGNVQPSNGLGHGSKNVRALHRLTGTAARSTLLAAGLGGLGLLVLLVEGDRRMMRRARRRLNVEDRTG